MIREIRQHLIQGDRNTRENHEGRAAALPPILIFLLIFLGPGFITGDFYNMPAIVAFLIALLAAFVQNRELGLTGKIKLAAQGVGDENIITTCLIFLVAGVFTGAVKAVGDVDSMVNLGLSILLSNVVVARLFLIECSISIFMGTSVGTITVLALIVVRISQKTELPMAVCADAVMGDAMFGGNLSMVSDTAIAAVRTQGCEIKDKFRESFLIVLSVAITAVPLFLVLGKDVSFHMQGSLDYSLLRVVPYTVVLTDTPADVNVFLVFMTGTVLSLIAGVTTGAFGVRGVFTHVGAGITGMYGITVTSVVVAYAVALVKEYEGTAFIPSFIRKGINGRRRGESGIAVLALLIDICTANNTVVIVMVSPIAEEIGDDFGVTPRRPALLLGIFSSMGQGLTPHRAQLLVAVNLIGLIPLKIISYCFYPILMEANGLLSIFIRKRYGKVLV